MDYTPDAANAPIEQSAGYRRVNPDAVSRFADDFSSLLTTVQSRDIGPENARRLDLLLSSFEDLAAEMRQASADIKKLLGT